MLNNMIRITTHTLHNLYYYKSIFDKTYTMFNHYKCERRMRAWDSWRDVSGNGSYGVHNHFITIILIKIIPSCLVVEPTTIRQGWI